MPHHLDLYVKTNSPLERIDARAKLVAVLGYILAILLAPLKPSWPLLTFLIILLGLTVLSRLPARFLMRRLLSLIIIIGIPFIFSRLGGAATREAGELFAAKSLLVATTFFVLLGSTRAILLLEIAERLPLLSVFGQLGEFMLRGADLLAEEVMRTNRAWTLRAPRAPLKAKLLGLTQASISLLGRAAARAEYIGAAMVLRGFNGKLPRTTSDSLPWPQFIAGVLFGLIAIGIAGIGRWR